MTLDLCLGIATGALCAASIGALVGWWHEYRGHNAALRQNAELRATVADLGAQLERFAERHVWDVNARGIPAVDEQTNVINHPGLRVLKGGRF